MLQSFSTDLIPAPDRLEAWRHNARQICGDCQFRFSRNFAFHGSIQRRQIAGLELTLFSSSALSFSKFPAPDRRAESRSSIIITQLAGVREYRQAGKSAVLSKGDTTLIDSGLPWSSDCAGDCARLYLRVPQPFIAARVQKTHLPGVMRISGSSGLGLTLFHLMTSLYQQAAALTPQQGAAAVDAYLQIFSACLDPAKVAHGAPASAADPVGNVLHYIDQHLSDAALCPSSIASAAGISVRHLHRLFASRGCTVGDWIRVQRLNRCWRELSDLRFRRRSITDIAFFWGFNDSAHFSHSFKKQFGISARSLRSQLSGPEIDAAQRPQNRFYLDSENSSRAKPS